MVDHSLLSLLQRLRNRPEEAHKYDFGHVAVVGGQPGMVGAPFLASLAALRIGAGLVTIASSSSVIDKLEKRVLEIMTMRLPEQPNQAIKDFTTFVQTRHVTALVIGPGQSSHYTSLDRAIIAQTLLPTVIDGGALSVFHDNVDDLKHRDNLILTPHDGEYKKLTGHTPPTDGDARSHMAAEFARLHHVTLVLKGPHTIVAAPDGQTYINTTGNPGLATAGTGDVLAGMIGGLLAQDFTPTEAARLGVYLHGLAGDIAADKKTAPGMIASDVIDCLPTALQYAFRQ